MGNKTIVTRRYWRGTQGQWLAPSLSKFYRSSETYSRSGADNPKFRDAIKRGMDATNSLVTTNQSVYYKPGKITAQWYNKGSVPARYGQRISTDITDNWVPLPHSALPGSLFMSSVSNAALIGIIKKIRKHETSDFAGPTFVGELRETVSMIRSPFKSLRTKTGLFTDLHMRILRDKQKKGERFKPESWSKVLTDTWLEWTFGAAPLISDIAGIADLYLERKTAAFSNGLKRLSYRYSDDYNTVKNPGYSLGWAGTGITVDVDLVEHARSSAQYVVWIDQSLIFADSQMDWLRNASKFRLDEIIPTAWELMPWSFLIDYWTNIGDVLGCTFDFNRNVAFAKFTDFNTVTRFHANFRPKSAEPDLYGVVELIPHSYTSQYTRVSRSSVNRLGFPQLDVSLPSLGQSFNMAALMISLRNNNPFRGFTLK